MVWKWERVFTLNVLEARRQKTEGGLPSWRCMWKVLVKWDGITQGLFGLLSCGAFQAGN